MQGDVVAIYNTDGVLQAKYSYDAWGNCTVTNSTNAPIANYNPIRYRGYYLDTETNWYFLNARYYSPEWRRFISPDDTAYLDPENVNGLNLYAYCNNDPINFVDPSGHLSLTILLLTALTCGVISAGANAIGQAAFEGATWETLSWEKVAIAGVSGFLAGLIPGTGFMSLVAQGAVSSITERGLNALVFDEEFNIVDVAIDVGLSLGAGYIIKGLTSITSKVTSKIFIKGQNWTQYQRYLRRLGYYLNKLEVKAIMKVDRFYKELVDEIIDANFNLASSVLIGQLKLN